MKNININNISEIQFYHDIPSLTLLTLINAAKQQIQNEDLKNRFLNSIIITNNKEPKSANPVEQELPLYVDLYFACQTDSDMMIIQEIFLNELSCHKESKLISDEFTPNMINVIDSYQLTIQNQYSVFNYVFEKRHFNRDILTDEELDIEFEIYWKLALCSHDFILYRDLYTTDLYNPMIKQLIKNEPSLVMLNMQSANILHALNETNLLRSDARIFLDLEDIYQMKSSLTNAKITYRPSSISYPFNPNKNNLKKYNGEVLDMVEDDELYD